MDHFAAPTSFNGGRLLVDYIARKDYLGVPFDKYLEHFLPTYPANRLDSFAQTWLFFCVLQDALGDAYQHDDFVRTITTDVGMNRVVLATHLLNQKLQVLDLEIKSAVTGPHSPVFQRLKRLHVNMVQLLGRLPIPQIQVEYEILGILASIMTVVSEVMYANNVVPRARFGMSISPAFPGDYLKMAGWCVADAGRAWVSLPSMPVRWYWTKLAQATRLDEDHSKCMERHCDFASISSHDYKLRHAESGCDCDLFRIDQTELIGLLEETPRVLLRVLFNEDRTASMGLVEMTPGIPYLAVSHVWADGYGNPRENALHNCMIAALVCDLRPLHEQFCPGEPAMHIWIDSLCIPTGSPEIKPRALSEMKTIYRSSAATLVIDSMLSAHDIEVASSELWVETAMLVVISRWMGRLWTLQEAVLPPILYFKFKNTYIHLVSIGNRLIEIRQRCASEGKASLAIVCTELLNALEAVFNPYDQAQVLNQLASQVTIRSLSNFHDEPICLSILVNASIPEFPICFSMQRFWKACVDFRLLSEFSILHSQKMLDTPGYRWAPASLLRDYVGQLSSTPERLSFCGPYDLRRPILVPQGLMIHRPAFLISAGLGSDMRNLLLSACLIREQGFEILEDTGLCWNIRLHSCALTIPDLVHSEQSIKKMAIILESMDLVRRVIAEPGRGLDGVLVIVVNETEHYTVAKRVGAVGLTLDSAGEKVPRRLPPFDVAGLQGMKGGSDECGDGPRAINAYISNDEVRARLNVTEVTRAMQRWIVD